MGVSASGSSHGDAVSATACRLCGGDDGCADDCPSISEPFAIAYELAALPRERVTAGDGALVDLWRRARRLFPPQNPLGRDRRDASSA